MRNDEGLEILARNARVQLNVPTETLSYFRPRRGDVGNEAAIIRLTAVEGSQYFAKIIDEREDSAYIARGLANIRLVEKAAQSLLDQTKVKAAKAEASEAWPEFLGLNASILLAFEETTKGRSHPVLVLRDPEEVEEDGFLSTITFDKDQFSSFTVRESNGSWIRSVVAREEEENINHFLLITVTDRQSPIVIFHREIKDGLLTATDILLADERRIIRRVAKVEQEVWLEGGPNDDISVEVTAEEVEPEKKPEPEPAPPKKKTEKENKDSLAKLGFGKADAKALTPLGITSGKTLLDQIERTPLSELATDTGIEMHVLETAVSKAKSERNGVH